MVDHGGESAGTDGTAEGGVAKATPALEGRIKRLPLAGILGSAAVILVVGLLVGLGVGYKIEQTRVKNDVKTVNAQASKNAAAPAQSQAQSASVQLRGKVTTAAANAVNLTFGTTSPLLTNQATIVVKATPGTSTDIAVGARVVWVVKKGRPTQVDAVIVLPANAKVGAPVLSATANSMTLKRSPKNVTFSTNGATVEKVTAAEAADIASGAKVVVQALRTNQALVAVEVIVLPNTNKFVP